MVSRVAGLIGNITNSAPNWVGLGLGLSLAIIHRDQGKFISLVGKSKKKE